MRPETRDDYVWKSPEELAVPISGHVKVYLDAWWPHDAEGLVAFYSPLSSTGKRTVYGREYGAAQCNADKSIADRRARHEFFTGVIQLPIVFAPLDIGNY